MIKWVVWINLSGKIKKIWVLSAMLRLAVIIPVLIHLLIVMKDKLLTFKKYYWSISSKERITVVMRLYYKSTNNIIISKMMTVQIKSYKRLNNRFMIQYVLAPKDCNPSINLISLIKTIMRIVKIQKITLYKMNISKTP